MYCDNTPLLLWRKQTEEALVFPKLTSRSEHNGEFPKKGGKHIGKGKWNNKVKGKKKGKQQTKNKNTGTEKKNTQGKDLKRQKEISITDSPHFVINSVLILN